MDESELINKTVETLNNGGVVIFPTDTVWGIGVSIKKLDAIKRLYEIKGRSKDKPTAVLVGNIDQAKKIAYLDKETMKLIDRFWPGGLTLVVKSKPLVPKIIRGRGGTVGIRMPDNKLVIKILTQLGNGMVTASANFACQPPPVDREMIDKKLLGLCNFLIEGNSGGGLPSTVIDMTVRPYKIIRQGPIKIFA